MKDKQGLEAHERRNVWKSAKGWKTHAHPCLLAGGGWAATEESRLELAWVRRARALSVLIRPWRAFKDL